MTSAMCDISRQRHQEAVAALKRLTHLSYNQKQLLASGEVRQVLEHVRRRRRLTDAVLLFSATLPGFHVMSGLASGHFPWFAAGLLTALVMTVRMRRRKWRDVTTKVHEYEASSGEIQSTDPIVTELRLNHRLSFEEQQQLKSGDIFGAARSAMVARWSDGMTLLLGAVFVDGLWFMLALCTLRRTSAAPHFFTYVIEDFVPELISGGILLTAAAVIAAHDLRLAWRLWRMVADTDPVEYETPDRPVWRNRITRFRRRRVA